MKSFGLEEKAKLLKVEAQKNSKNHSKETINGVMGEDELYSCDKYFNVEAELDSSDKGLSIGNNLSSPRSKYTHKKLSHMKKGVPKTMALALAFKKKQQKFNIQTRSKCIDVVEGPSDQTSLQCSNDNDVETNDKMKPTRGPTMCNKVHGRSEEERLEIILNEHGQPIGPDDKTLNEFTSFLGTIARKANILPLIVKNWPSFKKDKRDELWGYVLKHYIVPIEGKKWVLQTIGACWRCYKCRLKKKHFRKFTSDAMRMKNRPRRVPKTMFKELLKIWHSDEHKKISEKNTTNQIEGKKKNIMHTTGPKSFARVREDWKKEKKTTKNPTLAEMFIATRKEKRTKRKAGEPRDKLICELKASSSQSVGVDKEDVVVSLFNSKDKNYGLPLHGRGVSNTKLKQKVMMEELQKKHDEKMEALKKNYEAKR